MVNYSRLTKESLVELVKIYSTLEITDEALKGKIKVILDTLGVEFVGLQVFDNGNVSLENDDYYIDADSIEDLRLVIEAIEMGRYSTRDFDDGFTKVDINEDENGNTPKYTNAWYS